MSATGLPNPTGGAEVATPASTGAFGPTMRVANVGMRAYARDRTQTIPEAVEEFIRAVAYHEVPCGW